MAAFEGALRYHPEYPDANIQTRSKILLVDTFGRPTYIRHENDVAIPEDDDLPAPLAEKSITDIVMAYVCEGTQCAPPISSRQEWEALIDDSRAALDPAG